MANDVTVNINAETNVPEAADKSKKAMGQMEKAMEGINKKMGDFGKDLILSYIAPMVLLNRAFDYIGNRIEENKQKAKEALDFAAKGESSQLDQGTISLARKRQTREQEAKDKEMAQKASEENALDFLRNASKEDMERFYKRMGPGSKILTSLSFDTLSAKEKSVQNAVRDVENANVMRAQEEAAKGRGPGIDSLSVQNPVFGVGTVSPIAVSLDKQLEEQQKQTMLLERIASNAPAPVEQKDYTKLPNRATPHGL